MTDTGLAAHIVADVYDAINRSDLSAMLRAGKAHDFPEVATVASRLSAYAARTAHHEAALEQYADPHFWDADTPGGPLALHDGGEMARNVLAGRPPFFHRD